MIENLIVMLIVAASAWYAGARYLPAKWRGKQAQAGCGSGGGCDTCNACATPAVEPGGQRVIMIQRQH